MLRANAIGGLVVVHPVQRLVVDRGADASLGQQLDTTVAGDRCLRLQYHRKDMPGMVRRFYLENGQIKVRQGRQAFLISPHAAFTATPELFRPLQLGQAHRCVQVGHIVFIARRNHIVFPRRFHCGKAVPDVPIDAMQSHDLDAPRDGLVIGDHHATLARGDGFVGIEAKAGHIA